MSSTPNTPTQNVIDFRDRNAVERFLETKRFRRCTNLRCDPVSHPNMQMLYMPVCVEGRFAKEGFAQDIDLPLPTRPLSPITYTTIPIWAPLISCPRHCKGYHNRTVAKVRALFKKQSHKEDSPKKEPWSRGEKIAAWTLLIAVLAIGASFFVPEVRQFFHLEKRAGSQVISPTINARV